MLKIAAMRVLACRRSIRSTTALIVALLAVLCAAGAAAALTSVPLEAGPCIAAIATVNQTLLDSPEAPLATVSASDGWATAIAARWLSDASNPAVEVAAAITSFGPRSPPTPR